MKKASAHIGIFLNGMQTKDVLAFRALGHNCGLGGSSISLKEKSFTKTFFVDGGIKAIRDFGHVPIHACFVGDFDSSQLSATEFSSSFPDIPIITLDKEKNMSDFSVALENIGALNYESMLLEIFWGLGGRFDHELINIAELVNFITKYHLQATCVLHPNFVLTNSRVELGLPKNQPFSIFSPLNVYPLEAVVSGAKYADKITLSGPSHGLSNVVVGAVTEIIPQDNLLAIAW